MNQTNSYNFDDVVPAVIASGVAVSLATFQEPDGLLVDAGQPSGNYVDVAGYVGLTCMSAPTSIGRITASEKASQPQIESTNQNHVWLAGYFPEIASHTEWRCIVDGVTYNVLGGESDSQSRTTRVEVQVATI